MSTYSAPTAHPSSRPTQTPDPSPSRDSSPPDITFPDATSPGIRTSDAEPTTAAFVRAYTRLAPVAYVPELRIHQADEPIGLWELTEGEFRSEQPPPFWAFAWAGGQALARYLLDRPEVVAGRRVLDLASGSGLVAVAAARCGAASVRAVDIDPFAVAAVGLNARANGVDVHAVRGDILDDEPGDVEVVLAGDVFYSEAMAARVLRFLLRATAAGARVLVGDPGRAYLPRPRFRRLVSFDVPVPPALESVSVKTTTVWQLNPPTRPPKSQTTSSTPAAATAPAPAPVADRPADNQPADGGRTHAGRWGADGGDAPDL